MLNKPNKRWSAMNIGRVGIPPLPVDSRAADKISPADRRMIAGVYWGFLDTGLALGNSGNYADAKKIFDGEDRAFSGVLPYNMLWTVTDGFGDDTPEGGGPDNRKDVLDTGFYAVPCSKVADVTAEVGEQTMAGYIAENDELPINIQSANNVIIGQDPPPGAVYSSNGCWDEEGEFIGNDGSTSCEPDLTDPKYRFRDTGGDPVGETYKQEAIPNFFRVPIFPPSALDKNGNAVGESGETLSLWQNCEQRIWDTHPERGQSIVDALDLADVDIAAHAGGAGIILDYEDFLDSALDENDANDPTTEEAYAEDPRMATASPSTELGRLYRSYVGEMLDARLGVLLVNATWIQEHLANCYDYDWFNAGLCDNIFHTAFGRKRIGLRFYTFGPGSEADPSTEILNLGNAVFLMNNKWPVSAQIADLWFSASSQCQNPLVPVGGPFTNIVNSIMAIRSAMALGVLRILVYRGPLRPAHSYFSAAVAYDGMQCYAEIIKQGTNFIPPAGVYRAADPDARYKITAYYGKDANNDEIHADTFITCRYHEETMLFYGGTLDGATRPVTVKAPTGDDVEVLATPYGNVKVVGPAAGGLKKIPLSHFVDRTDPLQPKGLMTANGLTSAMRNPMIDGQPTYGPYREHLLVDFRPRDNWMISGNRESVRQAALTVVDGSLHGSLVCDDEGAFIEEVATPTASSAALSVDNDFENGLFSLDADAQGARIAVMLAAIKVKDLVPTSSSALIGSQFGYFAPTEPRLNCQLLRSDLVVEGQTKFRAVLYNRAHADVLYPYPEGTNGEITTTDKWMLIQLVKEANNTARLRALGGQFGTSTPPVELYKEDDNKLPGGEWSTDRFRIPIRKQCRVGFATLAQYPQGGPGTAWNEIIWELFESEHVCKEYVISGTRIQFTCTNQVSWQIKLDGEWYKQSDTTGLWVLLSSVDPRRFYTNGATLNTDQFTAIQPVLKNSGDLNADTLAVLTSVAAGFP